MSTYTDPSQSEQDLVVEQQPASAEPDVPGDSEDALPPSSASAEAPKRARFGRFAVIVVCFIIVEVATLGAYFLSSGAEPVYGARAEILFDLRDVDFQQGDRQLETAAQIGGSRPVLAAVSDAVDIPLDEVEDALDFAPEGTSAVLEVSAEHPEPAVARALAQNAAEELLERLPSAGTERLDLARMEEELATTVAMEAEVEAQLRGLEQQRVATPGGSPIPSAEERALEAQLRQLINRRGQLESRLLAVELEQARNRPPEIVTAAYVLDRPVRPNPPRDALVGMTVGVGIAGLLVLALWWRRQARDHSPDGTAPAEL